jgi:hypothetical protein
MRIKYTREILEPIVKRSFSYANVLRELGLKQTGGSQSNIKLRIAAEGLDTSHFTGEGWSKGKSPTNRLTADQVLVLRPALSRPDESYRLRRALVEKGVKEICAECGLIPEWNGKFLRLQIDHKNGLRNDNRIDNLRFLCPNCHCQTDNWGVKNVIR